MDDFKKELEVLINKHSRENESNTPDFILARFLNGCLEVFNLTMVDRDAWYKPRINYKDIEVEDLK